MWPHSNAPQIPWFGQTSSPNPQVRCTNASLTPLPSSARTSSLSAVTTGRNTRPTFSCSTSVRPIYPRFSQRLTFVYSEPSVRASNYIWATIQYARQPRNGPRRQSGLPFRRVQRAECVRGRLHPRSLDIRLSSSGYQLYDGDRIIVDPMFGLDIPSWNSYRIPSSHCVVGPTASRTAHLRKCSAKAAGSRIDRRWWAMSQIDGPTRHRPQRALEQYFEALLTAS